jgi:hypothetical protein
MWEGPFVVNLRSSSARSQTNPTFDRRAVESFLRSLAGPSGDCLEIRLLDGSIDPRTRRIVKHDVYESRIATWGDDPRRLADEIARVEGVSVYVTVNPVNPALKNRADKLVKSRATTTDDDIKCLRRLPIDFDAVRPTGISSTEEERLAARDRLRKFLDEHPEFEPSATWGCSGNGYWMHILLPDYPNDEGHRALIARVIDKLSALYSDDLVELDPAVKNPSRIAPVVGTVKCKGISTPDRPHRMVTLESPAGKVPVPFDLVAWAALHAPEVKPGSHGENGHSHSGLTTRASSGSTGDVEKRAIAYLATIEPSVSGQKGSNKTFGAVCRVGPGFDLTEEEAYRLIDAHYNPRCVPPWSEKEIRHKVADAYKKAKTRGRLLKADRRESRVAPARKADGRPEIEINTERHIVLEETIRAIVKDPDLYCRGETLGIVIKEEGDTAKLPGGVELGHAKGNLRFIALSPSVLGCRLTRDVSFYRWKEDKAGEMTTVDCHPPDWLINAVADHRYWPGSRHLLSVAECPYVTADGTIAPPGFDAATGTLYRPSFKMLPLPDRPTRDDVANAWGELATLVSQFPFASTDDTTVWLTLLLTAIQRPMISGPVPGFPVNGNAAGCGKGLLIDIVGILVFGSEVGTRAYPYDPIEAAKVKLALALAAVPIVHFDNLTEGGFYGGGVIDSALTTTVASDRILGQSRDSGNVPLRPVWTLSGNNVSPRSDSDRRWLPCNLVTTLEKPYERSDIQEKDLKGHVREHRAGLIRAALVILKAHAVAGRPGVRDKQGAPMPWLGSYEEWDRVVRGAVWYATGNDCLETQRRATADKPDRLDKAALLSGWLEIDPGGKGMTIEEVLKAVADKPDLYPTLHSALMSISRDNRLPNVDRVKNKIRGMRKTPISKMRFESCGLNHSNQNLWRVDAC